MFDIDKARQLQARSHTRGLLSKQFYFKQQQQLQRKRKQMKADLDRQVQERRRKKQMQKLEQERYYRKEQDEIKNYYRSLQNRDRKMGQSSAALQGNIINNANIKNIQPYQTYPIQIQDSRFRANSNKNKASRGQLLNQVDIPLMPPLPSDYAYGQEGGVNGYIKNKQVGIPLLDLSEQPARFKKKTQKTTKRQKTLQKQKERSVQKQKQRSVQRQKTLQRQTQRIRNSRPALAGLSNLRQQRRSTQIQQSIGGSGVHALPLATNSKQQPQQIAQQIQEVQQQNRSLKMQLRRNQQALSLLLGAVRSNNKLDRYRVQAQRILNGMGQSVVRQEIKEQKVGLLPKITMRQGSIMQDYLVAAAKRNRKTR